MPCFENSTFLEVNEDGPRCIQCGDTLENEDCPPKAK